MRFTSSIEEDLARRDFTVNAIALSPEGTLVDPFGGQADLSAGVLRCVGDPARRFAEDALRILRLLRFASVLGFSVEENTARAARERRDGLRAIAHERVYAELNKLLCGEHAAAVLLEYPDILGVVLPEILPCVGFDQRNPHHCYDVWEHTARAVGAAPPTRVLRWTMLLHDLGKPKCFTQDANGIGHFYGHTAVSAEMAEEIMARLRFEHALAQGVRAQLACFDEMFPPERAAVHRMMARYGRETMWNLLQTKLADNAAKAPDGLEQAQKPWREALLLYNELLAENACCSLAELRIGGGELLAIGFSGRAVGRAKQRLLDEVASERLANEHGALVRRAERLYRSGWRGETDGREEETMANIMDYLDWRGDLPLTVSPFNEVDGLILAELSFINFEGIVPPPELGRGVPLRDAAGTYFARHNGQEIDMGVLVPGRIPDLMCRMAHSRALRRGCC